MYKTELVRCVARETGLSQRVVSQVLGASLRTIQSALVAGERVTVPGFGTFAARRPRPQRPLGAMGTPSTQAPTLGAQGNGSPRKTQSDAGGAVAADAGGAVSADSVGAVSADGGGASMGAGYRKK